MTSLARLVSFGVSLTIGLASNGLAGLASRGTLAFADEQALSPTGFILGHVVDQATSEPIAGAKVSLRP